MCQFKKTKLWPLCNIEPRGNWKALCDSQILSRPLDSLVCTKTLQISARGCGTPPRTQSLDTGFLAMAIMPRAVCGMPQRMSIQAILLGPWQQRKKPIGCKSLKEIILRKQSLGSGRISCRDPSGWVAFWLTYSNSEIVQGERKVNMTFWRDAWEGPSDDFINRPFDCVFASSLGHLRAMVLRLSSLRGIEGCLVCPCGMVSVFQIREEMMSSAESKGGGLVRKVQETSGGLEQLPLCTE